MTDTNAKTAENGDKKGLRNLKQAWAGGWCGCRKCGRIGLMASATVPEIAVKLNDRYNFLPKHNPKTISWMFSAGSCSWHSGEDVEMRQSRNVGLLLQFCAESLIAFQIRSRLKDQASTNNAPRKLEFQVTMSRPFLGEFAIESESSWQDSLQTSLVQALGGVLLAEPEI